MGDDLFKDCDCGDCNCGDFDCDCCDCDCNCDDCLPGGNIILICCCITPAAAGNDPNRTNRAYQSSPGCFPCCCCERRTPRRRNHQRRKQRKKKGFCCWRLWCCFARNDPSPPPSPPRRGHDRRDGRYPTEDLDLYTNDRRARHHDPDMPPRGYKSGGRYPEDMRVYRDDQHYARNDPKEARKDYDERDRWTKRGDVGKANKKDNTRRVVVDVPPKDYGKDERTSSSEEIDGFRGHHPRPDDDLTYDTKHQGHKFQGKWSSPVKYEDSGRQTKG